MPDTRTTTRWQKLADQLTAAGFPVAVSTRTYPGGSSCYIGKVIPGVGYLEVADTWWSKNEAVWTGYTVALSGTDSIVKVERRRIKRRAEVVAAVTDALEV